MKNPNDLPLLTEVSSPSICLGPAQVEGISPAMCRVQALIRRIAPTDRPVLVLGPTGSGKEVVAQQLHALSRNAKSPFVDINCSSIPESLMEAELFGHERGAFTGAVTSRVGYLSQVGDGTLFLDEIGDLPMALQPKLLRVLETKQFRSVGSNSSKRFCGRIVAATHRDLASMVRAGSFREDLYYRLNVFTIEVPCLDRRREDIPLLAQHFAARQNRPIKLGDDALQLLAQAHWPGNVRQLRNTIDRIAVLGDGEHIDATAVAQFLSDSQPSLQESFDAIADRLLQIDGEDKISALEHLLVDRVLRDCGGNKSAAARMLGVNRKVIERRVQSHVDSLRIAKEKSERARLLMEASDYSQALATLDSALEMLRHLPSTPEERKTRFGILRQISVCKRSQDGWLSAEALDIAADALRVGRDLVEPQELSTLMFGSWTAHLMRLELGRAQALAVEMRLRGIDARDAGLQIDGGVALANTRFWRGEFEAALALVDELDGLPGFRTTSILRQGMHPTALVSMLDALAAHQLGNAERRGLACANLRDVCAKTDHAFTLAVALQGCAWVACLLDDRHEVGRRAEQLLGLTDSHGFAFYHGVARVLAGYALSSARPADAERMMRSGFEEEMALHGGLLFHSFYSLLLSRHYLGQGEARKAREQAQRAIQVCMEHRELAYLSELLCLEGKAAKALGDLDAAEAGLRHCVATAAGLGSVPPREEAIEALASIWHRRGNTVLTSELLAGLDLGAPREDLVLANCEES